MLYPTGLRPYLQPAWDTKGPRVSILKRREDTSAINDMQALLFDEAIIVSAGRGR